jgi:uncharacterized Tic20 family protein
MKYIREVREVVADSTLVPPNIPMSIAAEPSSEFVDRPWMEGAEAPSAKRFTPPRAAKPRVVEADRGWMVACHLAPLAAWTSLPYLGCILIPLLIWQLKAKPEKNQRLASCAVEALNFQISLLIVSFILTVSVVGLVLLMPLMITGIVYSVIASVKTHKGEDFVYPHSHRFIKNDLIA